MRKKRCVLMLLLIMILSWMIYDVKQMQGKRLNTYAKSDVTQLEEPAQTSLTELIEHYLEQEGIPLDLIQIHIKSYETQEVYAWNEDAYVTAASIYKLPLAMLYYEKIQEGTMRLEDSLLYEAYHYEAGGPIGDTMYPGSYLRLETILHDMIVYSDNTAGHILFEHLGGWVMFKQSCEKYSTKALDEVFYSYDNVMNASYMGDVLDYLYEHKNQFQDVWEDMEQSMPNDYLNKTLGNVTIQKYGQYGDAVNAVGIVDGDHPYHIVIFSQLGLDMVDHIGAINALCYEYFNQNER